MAVTVSRPMPLPDAAERALFCQACRTSERSDRRRLRGAVRANEDHDE
jgi:hypothetical protein